MRCNRFKLSSHIGSTILDRLELKSVTMVKIRSVEMWESVLNVSPIHAFKALLKRTACERRIEEKNCLPKLNENAVQSIFSRITL